MSTAPVGPVPTNPALDLVVITGLSGAGRSTAAKCLEDLGWFVVDNLPPSLVATMVDLASRSQGSVDRIAVVVDVRSRGFTSDVHAALAGASQAAPAIDTATGEILGPAKSIGPAPDTEAVGVGGSEPSR